MEYLFHFAQRITTRRWSFIRRAFGVCVQRPALTPRAGRSVLNFIPVTSEPLAASPANTENTPPSAMKRSEKFGVSNRYENIDALRGLAAFAVVLFHLTGGMKAFVASPTAGGFLPAFGYSGVFLFFVISGFCIHLRWAKRRSEGIATPKIDFWGFWKRRWRRLYPAYIATLILFTAWMANQAQIQFGGFFVYDMISHLLMLHNLDGRTVYSLNGVLWTLAIEEQLYLLYFVLLAVRVRFGWTVTLSVCFAMRFVWFALSYGIRPWHDLPFTEGALANWWIWALGAIAVEGYLGVVKPPRWTASPLLAGVSLFTAGFLNYGMFTFGINTFSRVAVLLEPIFWGIGFFALINFVMRFEGRFKGWPIRITAFVGIYSYSLYLTHEFVLRITGELGGILAVLCCLVFAYIFFLLFERPFLSKPATQVQIPAAQHSEL